MKIILLGAAGLALTLAIGGYQVHSRNKPRPNTSTLESEKAKLVDAQKRLAKAITLPLLPPVQESYKRVKLLLESCGLSVSEGLTTGGESIPGYSGAAFHYRASVAGPPIRVISCMYIAVQTVPMTLDAFGLDGTQGTANYTVIGSQGPEDESPV